jgi:hypothetical protein
MPNARESYAHLADGPFTISRRGPDLRFSMYTRPLAAQMLRRGIISTGWGSLLKSPSRGQFHPQVVEIIPFVLCFGQRDQGGHIWSRIKV